MHILDIAVYIDSDAKQLDYFTHAPEGTYLRHERMQLSLYMSSQTSSYFRHLGPSMAVMKVMNSIEPLRSVVTDFHI